MPSTNDIKIDKSTIEHKEYCTVHKKVTNKLQGLANVRVKPIILPTKFVRFGIGMQTDCKVLALRLCAFVALCT